MSSKDGPAGRKDAAFFCPGTHPLTRPIRLHCMPATIRPMPTPAPPDDFASQLAQLRPRLHRYCARMAGSALDGEDIVQEALAKAALHYDPAAVRHAEAWLFRIAHNTALDFLRHRALERGLFSDEPVEEAAALLAADDPQAAAEATAAALAAFVRLPVAQRSAVILADVLGYALAETAQIMETTVPAIKAALHRGRARLREFGRGDAAPAALSPDRQALLEAYALRFNAHDFDGLRNLLAEEVRLDLVGRLRLKGRAQVSGYFGNYAQVQGLRAEVASIEGKPGLRVFEPGQAGPAYAIVLRWVGSELAQIRDFRYARYVMESLRP